MKLKLTINSIKQLEPKDKVYDVRDTDIAGFALRIHPTGNKTYLLFYRNSEGAKRTFTIGNDLTATQAREIAQSSYADVKKGIDINLERKKQRTDAERRKNITYLNFLEDVYRPWLLENRNSGKNTYTRLNSSFRKMHHKLLDDITQWDMEGWRSERKKNNISDATIKNEVAELKAMLNRAIAWGFIESHQLSTYKLPKAADNKIVRYLSDDERTRLYNALNERSSKIRAKRISNNKWREKRQYEPLPVFGRYVDHIEPMVLLALNTGMRRGEIFSLEWSNIDFSTKLIQIHGDKAKGKTTRHIPINDTLFSMLGQWQKQKQDEYNFVFPSNTDQPFDNIYKAWDTLLENANIKEFRFHDLRHDFASRLVMEGADLYAVKELLGHSTITVTERYAHLAPEKLTDAIALLN